MIPQKYGDFSVAVAGCRAPRGHEGGHEGGRPRQPRTAPISSGREPHVVGRDLGFVQYGWPVGMPLCRSLGGGLWEVRSNLPSRRIARILFFLYEGQIAVVHGFIKKTQRTPPEDIALARQRMGEIADANDD